MYWVSGEGQGEQAVNPGVMGTLGNLVFSGLKMHRRE